MKMHARAEREAVEMITIITRLDQSSLGGLKKKKNTREPRLDKDLLPLRMTLFDFGQLSVRHLCPFQASTPNVLFQARHARGFFFSPLLFNFM